MFPSDPRDGEDLEALVREGADIDATTRNVVAHADRQSLERLGERLQQNPQERGPKLEAHKGVLTSLQMAAVSVIEPPSFRTAASAARGRGDRAEPPDPYAHGWAHTAWQRPTNRTMIAKARNYSIRSPPQDHTDVRTSGPLPHPARSSGRPLETH